MWWRREEPRILNRALVRSGPELGSPAMRVWSRSRSAVVVAWAMNSTAEMAGRVWRVCSESDAVASIVRSGTGTPRAVSAVRTPTAWRPM